MTESSYTPAEKAIIDLLTKVVDGQAGGKGETRSEKSDKTDEKQSRKKRLKAARDNVLAIVGLSTSMWSFTKIVGDQLNWNASLAKSLGQTGDAVKGMTRATRRFNVGQQSTEQAIKVFSEVVEMGMSKFSDKTLQFGTQLKVLGIQNKAVFSLMRANTQGLGLSEGASLTLADQLVSTAIENKDSISGLIDAINSMKAALIGTSVELGPKAALNAQKIAARMSQGNSELQSASAKFVKSFLAGSDGFMKAAKLGVQFTGNESEAGMARKFEQLLGKVQALQSGKQGTGSQFYFDAMEKAYGLSREDFNLQSQIGTSIAQLSESAVESRAKESTSINLQQQLLNSFNAIQFNLIHLTQKLASGFAKLTDWLEVEVGPWAKKYFGPIVAALTTIAAVFGVGGFLAVGGALIFALKMGFKPLVWLAEGLGWLGKGIKKMTKSPPKTSAEIAKSWRKNAAKAGHKPSAEIAKSWAKNAAPGGAAKKASSKMFSKATGKAIAKKIPLVSIVAGLGFGIWRAAKGDFAGAALELASGVAGTIPGLGTAASLAADAKLLHMDMKAAEEDRVNRAERVEASLNKVSTTQTQPRNEEQTDRIVAALEVGNNNTERLWESVNTPPPLEFTVGGLA